MTLTDEFKSFNEKIKANQAQYVLDREAVKISALSSKELDKYEYLTGEDLRYKPGVVEQVKFEYYPLGIVFNKRLEKEDKKEGYKCQSVKIILYFDNNNSMYIGKSMFTS